MRQVTTGLAKIGSVLELMISGDWWEAVLQPLSFTSHCHQNDSQQHLEELHNLRRTLCFNIAVEHYSNDESQSPTEIVELFSMLLRVTLMTVTAS